MVCTRKSSSNMYVARLNTVKYGACTYIVNERHYSSVLEACFVLLISSKTNLHCRESNLTIRPDDLGTLLGYSLSSKLTNPNEQTFSSPNIFLAPKPHTLRGLGAKNMLGEENVFSLGLNQNNNDPQLRL